ncbi:hypothetical protein EMPG_15606 [Blastomyces silverae]|uniref:Uncharacterized protein n=1 Tax=Blastomyces silverae TaxID=2060906 RepID=A0A0H1BC88_9EURO|nr:hypothetical protein EMPG_15606 [Blastomyces silverae]
MNCPSRTDQCPDHPDWNQSPPLLTADLTTCEDLNGIVNSRAYKNRDSHLSCDSAQTSDGLLQRPPENYHPPLASKPGADAGCHFLNKEDTCSATRAWPPVIGHATIWPIGTDQRSRQRRVWIWRIALFVLFAYIFYAVGGSLLVYAATLKSNLCHKLPTTRLQRRGTCSNNPAADREYNTPLHVGALMIILSVSTLACSFPLVAVKFTFLRIPAWVLFFIRHFGTGVLIATAFVHLLPTAFGSLNDPCLPRFWTIDYQPMPGAIALAAVFLVSVVEMIFSPGRHCCSDGGNRSVYMKGQEKRGHGSCGAGSGGGGQTGSRGGEPDVEISKTPDCDRVKPRPRITTDASLRRERPLVGNSSSLGRELAHINADLVEMERVQSPNRGLGPRASAAASAAETKAVIDEHQSESDDELLSIKLTPEQQRKKAVMQCMLLEMGILFHSVFIGLALAVSTGSSFVVLLIAIAFHQTFEGLALGSRIAVIDWKDKTLQPWIMAVLYGCTTPLGQAIGLGTHTLYDPNSEVGLIMVGVMNAISSGLLVYSSLVELLAEDFLSDESWRTLRGKRRIYACLLVFSGAAAMSLVGAWA